MAGAATPSAGAPSGQGAESGFADMAAGGNPWRAPRQRSPKQRPPEGGPWRLGYVWLAANHCFDASSSYTCLQAM